MKHKSTLTSAATLCLLLSYPPTWAQAQVKVEQTGTEVTIGNAYLQRTFKIADGRLKPGALVNKRANNTVFTPSEGSEEFALNPAKQPRQVGGVIDRKSWTITADGYTEENGCGTPQSIIDGNAATYWHSDYKNDHQTMPHWFTIDMQEEHTIQSFGYTTRQAGKDVNGQCKTYELWAGADADHLEKVMEGTMEYSLDEQWINLPKAVTCRVVQFKVTSAWNGQKFAATAEFRLSTEKQAEANAGEDAPATITPIDRSQWSAEADSWCKESATIGEPKHAIDGNENTLWHTWYSGQAEGTPNQDALPHSFIIDLGSTTAFRAFGYLPRKGDAGANSNGNVKGYEFYTSDNKQDWTLVKKGELSYEEVATVWVDLGKECSARYVKFTETSSMNGGQFGACAEFYLTRDQVKATAATKTGLQASDMKLNGVHTDDIEGGKRVTFDLAPTAYTNPEDGTTTTWDIDLVVEMKDNDHFLRKYLLVKAADELTRNTPIDYIEMENLGTQSVADSDKWTRSQASGGVGGMTAYTLTLGQPVYVDGLFFGSEFPQAENEIDSEGNYHTRYYSGKSLRTLDLNEHRLNADGQFRTWNNVVGATRSITDHNIIRTDFFQYINSIARPVKARMQYNSWYDWMLTITESRINTSFKEMERGFSQYGLRPMDSYVVDDGWNSYNVSDTDRSGTKANESGFWEFNSKFPNGLKGASDIAHRYGSGFGIWLGPRGGYNFNSSWAKFLEQKGNGTYSTTTDDIVTGDSVYVAKLRDFFIKQQQEYGVNYWKLDGFATQQPQASKNGRYITGGKNGNYYFTEHWERWYNALNDMYADADTRHDNLWINLTCYVNPSPWILQWSNSVWIQNSQDMGRQNVFGRSREMDQQLSYRDDRYHEFIYDQQLQFPQANIFNHDPVYGKTNCVAANAMTDSEFRAYLYMMSTRGTAFWEMLYSYNLLNEGNKWMVNAEALNFIDRNFPILRHSIYFGDSPLKGNIYGYSCWNKDEATGQAEGIISFRNPSNAQKSYSLTLDNAAGVPEGATGLYPSLIMEYSGSQTEKATDVSSHVKVNDGAALAYGDALTVTLAPGEIRLIRLGAKDVQAASVITATSVKDNQVTLVMSEPVLASAEQFELKADGTSLGTAKQVATAPDYRTLTLTFDTPLDESKHYTVGIHGLQDWNGNATTAESPEFFFNPNSLVLHVDSLADLAAAEGVKSALDYHTDAPQLTFTKATQAASAKSFSGRGAFTLSFLLNTTESNVQVAAQGNAYSVSLADGCVRFQVGELAYTSAKRVNDGSSHHITCLRENNGMIKVYVDGELQGTAYDKLHLCEPVAAAPLTLAQDGKKLSISGLKLKVGADNYTDAEKASTSVNKYCLLTMTAPKGVALKFYSPAETLEQNEGQLVGRLKRNASVNVLATPESYATITSYVLNGEETELTLKAGAAWKKNLSKVNADQNIEIRISVPEGIDQATEAGYRLDISPARIAVSEAQGEVELKLYALSGQLLATSHGNRTATIEHQLNPKGAYVLKVKTAEGERSIKIVK